MHNFPSSTAARCNKYNRALTLPDLITECEKRELKLNETRKNRHFERSFYALPDDDQCPIPDLRENWKTNLSFQHMVTISPCKTKFLFRQFSCVCEECLHGSFLTCKSKAPVLQSFPKTTEVTHAVPQQLTDKTVKKYRIQYEKSQKARKINQNRQPRAGPIEAYELSIDMSIDQVHFLEQLASTSDDYKAFLPNQLYTMDSIEFLVGQACFFSNSCRSFPNSFVRRIVSEDNETKITKNEIDIYMNRTDHGVPPGYLSFILFSNRRMKQHNTLDIALPGRVDPQQNAYTQSGHWSVLVMAVEESKLYYLDSLGEENDFFSWTAIECFKLKMSELFGFEEVELKYVRTPRQFANDCGPLALMAMELVATDNINSLLKGIQYNEEFVEMLRLSHLFDLHHREFSPRIQLREIRDIEAVAPTFSSTPTVSREISKRPREIQLSDSPKRRRK